MQIFFLEYPPFDIDPISLLCKEEFWHELPINSSYETVTIPGDFQCVAELEHWVVEQNKQRRRC